MTAPAPAKGKGARTAKHSRGPWRIVDGEIVAADGEVIGVVYRTEAWTCGDPIGSEDQANAAFIVRAVNSHDAIVAALRKVLNYIENTESELGITLSCGDAARAALAQAEGEAK